MKKDAAKLKEYNDFCKALRPGNILYNINYTNLWGEYLLVAQVAHIIVRDVDTYNVMLLGLKKQDKDYVSKETCVFLTPDSADQIPFLKYVGYSHFTMTPTFSEINVNSGLASIYSQMDLHELLDRLSVPKPRLRKYGNDGTPVIKNTNN